jgi:hypothetical protein
MAHALAKQSRTFPSNATKANISRQVASLERLLRDEPSIKNVVGAFETLKPLVAKWLNGSMLGELSSPRNLRRLAYFFDSIDLTDPCLLVSRRARTIVDVMDTNWRNSYFSPLIMTYLRHFKDTGTESDAVVSIKTVLQHRLPLYGGSRKLPKTILLFRDTVLDNPDPAKAAKILVDTRQPWYDFCDQMGLSHAVQTTAFWGFVFLEYLRIIPEPLSFVDTKTQEKIGHIGDSDIIRISAAILAIRCDPLEPQKERLTSFLFSKVGDPANRILWKPANPVYGLYQTQLEQARILLAMWVNGQVLDYFFSRVSMDGGRRDFWQKYAPRMNSIRIAIHLGFGLSHSLSDNQDLDKWIRSRLVKVRRTTGEIALIMEFGEWFIIEIGASGNACYIYHKSNAMISKLGSSIASLNDLKQTHLKTLNDFDFNGEGRIIHYDGWQYTLRGILKKKMGLLP